MSTAQTALAEDRVTTQSSAFKQPLLRVSMLVGALSLSFLVVAAGLVLAVRQQSVAHVPVAAGAVRGTVAVVQTGSADEVVVHRVAGSMLTVSTPRLVASDGYTLNTGDVRRGDTVSVQGGRIMDLSQTRVSLQGLVAASPDPLSSTMIVQLKSGLQIVADLAPATRINGARTGSTSSLLIADADQVRLVGAFDARIGEMTRTESVAYSTPPR